MKCDRCGEVNPAEIHTCTPKVQEPVAWMVDGSLYASKEVAQKMGGNAYTLQALYTAPPQRTWVGLTNNEVNNFAAGCHLGKSVQGAIYEAEAKLKEKNT